MKEFSLKELVTYKGVAQEFSVKEFGMKEFSLKKLVTYKGVAWEFSVKELRGSLV